VWVCSESPAVAEAAQNWAGPWWPSSPRPTQGEELTAGSADYLVSGSIVYQVLRGEGEGPRETARGGGKGRY